jgi:hypothetical protein
MWIWNSYILKYCFSKADVKIKILACTIVVYLTRVLNGPTQAKRAQFTQERVEYNVFLFDELLKGSKALKIFKISFKLWHLSKFVPTRENSQILTGRTKKVSIIYNLFSKIRPYAYLYLLSIVIRMNNFWVVYTPSSERLGDFKL